jgi:hypothetical protein
MKKALIIVTLLTFQLLANAQIEVAHVSSKIFKETGFGAFLNFSFPVSSANYITAEAGLQYFKNWDEEDMAVVPILVGYRYTINHSGAGFYIEPNAGYNFGSTTIVVYENSSPVANDDGSYKKYEIKGLAAGVTAGYLFKPSGSIQFNLGLRYERTFGSLATNLFSFRISHAFSFGKK